MKFDPDATLRCWAVDVDVAGRTYTIPALPAADWLLALHSGALADVVPGLVDGTELDDAIADGTASPADCQTAARAAIAAAAGCPWWTAAKLAHAAVTTWVAADLTSRGVDPTRIPLAAWLAAAWHAASRQMDEVKKGQLEWELERPPQGAQPDEWWSDDTATANFMAAMGSAG